MAVKVFLIKNKWIKIAGDSRGGTVGIDDTGAEYKYVSINVGSDIDMLSPSKTILNINRMETLKSEKFQDWYMKSNTNGFIYIDFEINESVKIPTGIEVGGLGGTSIIEKDGTSINTGLGTTYDDVTAALIGRRLYSNAGKVDYDYEDNSIKMQPGGDPTNINDRIVFSLQYPHAAISNGFMNLHAHFEQTSSDRIEFRVDYRIHKNGSQKSETWIPVLSNTDDNCAFEYKPGGVFNQIIELADIDMRDAGLSATVQFRLTRIDTTADNIYITFVDAHVEKDMIGSRQKYIK